MSMKFGYARVSTQDQNLSLQIDTLRAQDCDKIYYEKVSGAKTERPELTNLLNHVREGDTIIVWKLDRLGRSLAHLVDIITTLEKRGVGLISINDPIDTTTAQGRLIFMIFASLAEFERDVIKERTKAGLLSARRRGQKLGRPNGLSRDAENKSRIAESLYKENNLSVNEIAKQLNISKTTLYSYLRRRGLNFTTITKI